MKRRCPICLSEDKLVQHHWYNDQAHMVGHIRAICHCCNITLKALDSDRNHVLPVWDKQVEFVRGMGTRIIQLRKVGESYRIRIPPYWLNINKLDQSGYRVHIIIDNDRIQLYPQKT